MYTFDDSFANFGDVVANYDAEIRDGLLKELTTYTKSTSFNRSAGIGVDLYENEMMSEVTKLKIRLDVVAAVDRYNKTVLQEKQILVSQEMVIFDEGRNGDMYITILYIQLKDINNSASAVQSFSIPI
jgi:hypothetical protein